MAFARDHERALATLELILRHLANPASGDGDGLFDDPQTAGLRATRIAGAVNALLTDPQFNLPVEWFFKLIPFKRQIQAIFTISGYRGTALPLRYMSDGVAGNRTAVEEQSQLLKMLLVMGLEDCSEGMLSVIRQLDPTAAAPLILSLVASSVVARPEAWRAREALIGMGDLLMAAQFNGPHLRLFADAWRLCCDSAHPDRREFKGALNRWRSWRASTSPKIPRRIGASGFLPRPCACSCVVLHSRNARHHRRRLHSDRTHQTRRAGSRPRKQKRVQNQVDPNQWQVYALEVPTEAGPIEVQTLRPRGWLDDSLVGSPQSVWLELEEINTAGAAYLTSVRPSPAIEEGEGCVVLSTFTRGGADDVLELRVEGSDEVLGVTANHPLYSLDRNAFIEAGLLHEGERLRTLEGEVTVISLTPRKGAHRVYNLEVETSHTYHVGESAILAHNIYPSRADGTEQPGSPLLRWATRPREPLHRVTVGSTTIERGRRIAIQRAVLSRLIFYVPWQPEENGHRRGSRNHELGEPWASGLDSPPTTTRVTYGATDGHEGVRCEKRGRFSKTGTHPRLAILPNNEIVAAAGPQSQVVFGSRRRERRAETPDHQSKARAPSRF